MRIISNFYEYYDCFSDKESYSIYERKESEVSKDVDIFQAKKLKRLLRQDCFHGVSVKLHHYSHSTKRIDDISHNFMAVGGVLYPFIRLTLETPSKCYFNGQYQDLFFYNSNDLKAFLKPFKLNKLWGLKEVEKEIEDYFAYKINNLDKHHLFYDAPILLFNKIRSYNFSIVVNPCLKDYKFMTVMDNFTAAQSISQFIETVLVKEKNVPVKISDLDKVKQHGFDKKTSFRGKQKRRGQK